MTVQTSPEQSPSDLRPPAGRSFEIARMHPEGFATSLGQALGFELSTRAQDVH